MLIGVLALQGGVEEHIEVLESLGAATRRVRQVADLEGLDGLVLPGGESTVIDRLARSFGLAEPLRAAIDAGLPVLATCAGLIYLARELENPAAGQQTLGALDVTVRRNAFGNQRFSAERVVPITLDDGEAGVDGEAVDVDASFIRAPIVTRTGPGVEAIATVSGNAGEGEFIVGVRSGAITALSFHPEENGDARVHAAWLAQIPAASAVA
ncbi:pyridoxal 5'-phosphate synthase glutaminase subunit PdxT [Corynebacterium phoceense]|uniref:pyridoxal 5'-phosphate synthase glutaminase subunit PdxT n=1 Tax=Corynebacterium phoceense TaxID=1686286 RepID=UPI00211BBCBF|nr:pyridoxal 5'-phosphate synthase glutaminase subunit PdxT [Corynebacterium phoceense]MCQ9331847.1 pyridoxal 5'-phosphate synthase glutaminase subunit PdxT [Corynebacterium phoceense]MCQ9345248.1 pyridoxal 5'-phosphate synthase glutaminase subunit PdxT [Corynebacterium phoceense]MCQ9348098.1 pyridoxal 5'-phosphate synthase glutaminase subunit PdxT [Corynebacterium phoceense]